MKTIIILMTLTLIGNAHACFLGETEADYQNALSNAYLSFEKTCDTGCFPVSSTCQRNHLICFQQTLAQLEAGNDCKESAVLVEMATNSCLHSIHIPLSTNR